MLQSVVGDLTGEPSNVDFYLGPTFATTLAFASAHGIFSTYAMSLYSPRVTQALATSAQDISGKESSWDFQICESGLIVACLFTDAIGITM